MKSTGTVKDSTTHDVKATFVSFSSATNKLTFKNETGEQKTAPVFSSAAKQVADLKGGDRLVITCKDEKGGHTGISGIRRTATEKVARKQS